MYFVFCFKFKHTSSYIYITILSKVRGSPLDVGPQTLPVYTIDFPHDLCIMHESKLLHVRTFTQFTNLDMFSLKQDVQLFT